MQELDKYPRVFLQTGDCFFGVMPTLVTTVLGSCVAVTMYCPEKRMSAICHGFLPDSGEDRSARPDPQACRYVDTAVYNMLEAMYKLGARNSTLQVKIMGGAAGLSSSLDRGSNFRIGERNVNMARRILASEGIRISKMDVGGDKGRKVLFLTHTGEAWIKRLSSMATAREAQAGKPLGRLRNKG
ncbi:chemotaxis protein CheD [Paucidesulfovibrio gracilis DSM 16080]|uniref:Probable chemoreceptor glutamine deamidase CheD n=1 Tax=Paucidesulfovibrio gracilis DSM 16080 TaxID=1121449 RepID=A0A1T4Y435_9BACT|nr:chemotaxis protein CheD [Paucidesulfovibrio gracilis]SKA96577.1 chemotaxis protein CheD [Paucidesulfovibrio gracilis DSM 16080]